jgi:Asp-tRNA(Asn)/Glu-tRNA(Gln) amidotransferase A subunit family amidase
VSDTLDQTISDLAPQVARGTLTAESLTERCLARIAERNPELNAFITVTADEALAGARKADAEIAAGRYRGALHGMPVSLKDLVDQVGTPTTAGSRVRAGHVADRDATVTRHLRDAGAVFVGKTNLHEFAFGTTTEDSAFGPARHPIDPARSPGGSSGGSAIAVRTGMSLASVGTDTGGSIRIPAAACGIVGLKPCARHLRRRRRAAQPAAGSRRAARAIGDRCMADVRGDARRTASWRRAAGRAAGPGAPAGSPP